MKSVSNLRGDRPLPSWRFWIPLGLQVLLVLMVPAQSLYARLSGTSVILQTAPVDPYSLLQGYYVTLRYDISRAEILEPLPGWNEVEAQVKELEESPQQSAQGMPIYVVLRAPTESSEEPPPSPEPSPVPWIPERVDVTYPSNLQENEIVLKGTYYGQQIDYGLERYFIPEAERDEINDRIRQAQESGDRQSYLVEVKVVGQGTSTLIGLWIDGEFYQF
ncbi:MAG: GDYXXLXY domain-containing protein [Leptolyngbyaceae bacterium]|nr:GDYXXLXY domain-containing protein [Leptolyngbyaceae bacterium]